MVTELLKWARYCHATRNLCCVCVCMWDAHGRWLLFLEAGVWQSCGMHECVRCMKCSRSSGGGIIVVVVVVEYSSSSSSNSSSSNRSGSSSSSGSNSSVST